nr:p18 protein [Areca palm velarivirus 1]UOV22773.1 p18 protein [Areca palm velarivirus 1]UOV22872.1 p18 protein [Areca palm velarivirus 1]UOV22883.1 p18 protein [Areca palm velarivirus 1]
MRELTFKIINNNIYLPTNVDNPNKSLFIPMNNPQDHPLWKSLTSNELWTYEESKKILQNLLQLQSGVSKPEIIRTPTNDQDKSLHITKKCISQMLEVLNRITIRLTRLEEAIFHHAVENLRVPMTLKYAYHPAKDNDGIDKIVDLEINY